MTFYYNDAWIGYLTECVVRESIAQCKLECLGCKDNIGSAILHRHKQLSLLDKLKSNFERIPSQLPAITDGNKTILPTINIQPPTPPGPGGGVVAIPDYDEVSDEYIDDDNMGDDNLIILDDDEPAIVRPGTSVDYKRMYEQCLKEGRKMRIKLKKYMDSLKRKHHAKMIHRLQEQQTLYESKIDVLKRLHEQQMLNLEDLKNDNCNKEINKAKQDCQNEIIKIGTEHKKDFDDLVDECQRKMKLLDDQIKSMEEDDENLSSLTKAIFNCTSIEEILEIQRLIKNHQLAYVVQNHWETLQNIFLSLSYGILPICQPQRDKVTEAQRRVVEMIQTSSKARAKNLLKSNQNEIINLFTIINDSLKLARNSFNKYGTI